MKILKAYGIPDKFVRAIEILYKDICAKVISKVTENLPNGRFFKK